MPYIQNFKHIAPKHMVHMLIIIFNRDVCIGAISKSELIWLVFIKNIGAIRRCVYMEVIFKTEPKWLHFITDVPRTSYTIFHQDHITNMDSLSIISVKSIMNIGSYLISIL